VPPLANIQTGLAGALLAAAQLALRGWPVSVTYGNTKRTDLLAQVGQDLLPVAIQVKTKGASQKDWRLAKGIPDLSPPDANEWVVLVALRGDESPDFFVIPRNHLRGYVVAALWASKANTWGALGEQEFPGYRNAWSLMEAGHARDTPCLVEQWVTDVLDEGDWPDRQAMQPRPKK
jgi:hypothetical protein